MKINSTVLLTLTLLTLMLGAGSVSAYLGLNLGNSALKGVNKLDGSPTTNRLSSAKAASSQPAGLTFLKEEDILKTVKARTDGKNKSKKTEKVEEEEEVKTSKSPTQEKPAPAKEETLAPGFPIVAESEGVIMAVQSARYSGGDLLLKVKMQNKGADSVRFLYSFLDVTDDKGRTLSAITEGLPAELPSNGPEFTGTVSIPTSLLDDVRNISLALTDYPAQKLKLQLSDIPVDR
ncbi:MAG TPA: hypothetical protein VK203_09220 [Nostocaceae cyanobacterium]|nr:hypothetical protein [Nostocaceae cyanobacterium]